MTPVSSLRHLQRGQCSLLNCILLESQSVIPLAAGMSSRLGDIGYHARVSRAGQLCAYNALVLVLGKRLLGRVTCYLYSRRRTCQCPSGLPARSAPSCSSSWVISAISSEQDMNTLIPVGAGLLIWGRRRPLGVLAPRQR